MRRLPFSRLLFLALAAAALVRPLAAVESRVMRDDDFATLAQGELQSVALTSDGYLLPTYDRRPVGDTGAEIVWDAVATPDGVLCATGHQGRLVLLDDDGSTRAVATLSDPELTALLRLSDGAVIAAGAPSGRLYRVGADDVVTTWTRLDASFVWKLAQGPDGSVWAATGPAGRLFRITPGATEPKVEMVHAFGSKNLLDLWVDRDGETGRAGTLLVGGQDPGLLYRFDPARPEAIEVLYNSQAEEIRSIVPFGDSIALALNTERSPTPQALNLTLRMAGAPPPSGGAAPPAPSPGGAEQQGNLAQAFASARERQYGQPRSQIVLLDRRGFARELWTSPERPIHEIALAPDGVSLLAAAGSEGRLFEIDPEGDHSIVADLREDFIVGIVPLQGGYLLHGARNGLVYRMDDERVREATFISRPLDASAPVRWGAFHFEGTIGKGQEAQVAFRTGNEGDATSELWSEWSRPAEVRPNDPAEVPGEQVARFLQYRLTLRQKGGDSPVKLDFAEIFTIEPNRAPRIERVQVSAAAGQPPRPGGAPGSGNGSAPRPGGGPPGAPPASPSVAPPPSAGPRSQGSAPQGARREPRSNTMSITVNWTADDPNGDTLQYALYFKAEDESEWKLIDDELSATQQALQTSLIADGHYRFRLVATDAPSNPPGTALEEEQVSDVMTVDNSAPAIEDLKARVRDQKARITFEATDAVSRIASVIFDIDNGDTRPLLPVDGILDRRTERFEFETDPLEPGQHVATFAVTDAEGNTAVDKVVFTIGR